jgi:hypothetical protein
MQDFYTSKGKADNQNETADETEYYTNNQRTKKVQSQSETPSENADENA